MKYIDLSHTIEDGMPPYKGLPGPMICDFLSREASRANYDGETTFQIGQLKMVGNTGTYLDCPFHRFEEGRDFTQLFLSDIVDLATIKVDAPFQAGLAIGPEFFEDLELADKCLLIHTGWATHWGTDQYYEQHPFLTAAAASFLVDAGSKVVGIDSPNIDDTSGKMRPVHTSLLGADICIVEQLCQLHLIPNEGANFSAVPPKIRGIGSLPVRAFAKF